MRSLLSLALGTFLVSCSGGSATAPASSGGSSTAEDLGTKHPYQPEVKKEPDKAPEDGHGKPAPVADKPAPPPAGLDFADDARMLYRIAACGGADDDRVPETMSSGDANRKKQLERVAKGHCKFILDRIKEFRAAYFDKHQAWFAEHVPKTAPKTVVYPFGGGDLISALVAFPDATEITTISLEMAGDPRRIRTLRPDVLENSLGALRVEIGGLIMVGSNTSVNLSAGQRNELPGQVSSFMMGLVAGGYEPIAMRYFRINDDGTLHYHEQADLDAIQAEEKKKGAKSRQSNWASPNFSEAFANVEIQFKKIGDAQVRIHRHIGWNLNNEYLAKNPQLLAHLSAKGKVTILTKGGSYLLQREDFSTMRGWMLGANLAWMLSDSTGPAPTYAEPAGMVQETFGTYAGALLGGAQNNKHDLSMIKLFRTNPQQKLGFRFGYVDAAGAGHLIITRPRGT
ncbi:MAG: hypothetical protein KF773_33460 [Deltaproteobacteria bacterium]|nr:hypothetical protein [Deltaproteobacteria bacterium]